ncbi:MAG: hypothetical protein M5R40_24270 [Anaerolineae bacterium]|nr:hypothetical protein [Anaerolineae bacterium]
MSPPYPQYNLGVGASTCVNAATENPDAAAEVLNWFYEDKERAVRIIEGFSFGDFLVPLQFTREDFSADAPELLVNYFLALSDALAKKTFGFTTWTFLPARTHAWIGERYDLVVTNEMTTQEFMDGVQETYAEELAEGLAVPAPEPITPEEIGAM